MEELPTHQLSLFSYRGMELITWLQKEIRDKKRLAEEEETKEKEVEISPNS